MHPVKKKRKIDECPNRLFLSYLKTWRDDAGAAESKAYHTYNKAFKSMQKYPLPLQNGKEAIIIENIGDKICSMLDSKLNKDAQEKDMTPREFLEESRNVHSSWWASLEESNSNLAKKQKPKKTKPSSASGVQRKSRAYIPVKNSGGYAIMVALYKDYTSASSNGYMKKGELQRAAQPFCTKSFTVPDPGSQYTAWSSMATLLNKELVRKSGNPARFEITETGIELAAKLEAADNANENKIQPSATVHDLFTKAKTNKGKNVSQMSDSDECSEKEKCKVIDLTLSDDDDLSADKENKLQKDKITNKPQLFQLNPKEKMSDSQTSVSGKSEFELLPGQYEILLCVDSREVSGDKRKKEMRRELHKLGLSYDERVLQIGDFVWIAKEKEHFQIGPAKELVLDYVVERKCMSDLAQSIRDGRFHEQKIRLKQCGLKSIVYLVEDMKQIQHQSLPEKTLRQALHNTRITDGIFVKYCENMAGTAQYLSTMTRKLQNLYEGKTLRACDISNKSQSTIKCDLITFHDFSDGSMKCKGLTVTEMFIKLLMQIHGMSYDKAKAITILYPTPKTLFDAYRNCLSSKEKEELLSKVKTGLLQRNMGINLSRSVYHVFGTST
uniref:Crossover junction endonuclease MUS81 n=1 Tax=Phallusia mammillata TaxID=59560 RepID=A0A6F9DM72_9ASCI|nr:crossover junction endonuclease MUS81-like [Phallusia mammillata]